MNRPVNQLERLQVFVVGAHLNYQLSQQVFQGRARPPARRCSCAWPAGPCGKRPAHPLAASGPWGTGPCLVSLGTTSARVALPGTEPITPINASGHSFRLPMPHTAGIRFRPIAALRPPTSRPVARPTRWMPGCAPRCRYPRGPEEGQRLRGLYLCGALK